MVLRAFAHLPESLTDQPCSLRNKRKSGWPRAAALRVRHSLAAVLGGTGTLMQLYEYAVLWSQGKGLVYNNRMIRDQLNPVALDQCGQYERPFCQRKRVADASPRTTAERVICKPRPLRCLRG